MFIDSIKDNIKRFISFTRERKQNNRQIQLLLDKLESIPVEYDNYHKLMNSLDQILLICELLLPEFVDGFAYVAEVTMEYSHNLLNIMMNLFQKQDKFLLDNFLIVKFFYRK